MRKHTLVFVAVLSLLLLAGLALGRGSLQVASAHTLTPTVQTASNVVQTQGNTQQAGPDQATHATGTAVNGTENDPPDPGETAGSAEDNGQDQNLPGGGHQDQGQVDHQFEGIE